MMVTTSAPSFSPMPTRHCVKWAFYMTVQRLHDSRLYTNSILSKACIRRCVLDRIRPRILPCLAFSAPTRLTVTREHVFFGEYLIGNRCKSLFSICHCQSFPVMDGMSTMSGGMSDAAARLPAARTPHDQDGRGAQRLSGSVGQPSDHPGPPSPKRPARPSVSHNRNRSGLDALTSCSPLPDGLLGGGRPPPVPARGDLPGGRTG